MPVISRGGQRAVGTWATGTYPSTGATRMAYSAGVFVIVQQSGSAAYYSTDGLAWSTANLPASGNWAGLCALSGTDGFYAVTNNGTAAAYSTDGVTWSLRTMPVSTYWNAVAHSGTGYAAIGQSVNIAAYSTDGVSWSTAVLPATCYWSNVSWGGDKFVATTFWDGNTSNVNTTKFAYSADGSSWTLGTFPVSSQWYDVKYGNDTWVVHTLTSTTIACSSTDGVTWTQRTLASGTIGRVLAYGGGLFVSSGGTTANMNVSTDGITWALRTFPSSANRYTGAFGAGRFVTAGNGSTAVAAGALKPPSQSPATVAIPRAASW